MLLKLEEQWSQKQNDEISQDVAKILQEGWKRSIFLKVTKSFVASIRYVQNRLIKRLFQQFHHIRKLAQMLSSIRLAYLNLDGRVPPPSRLGPRNVDFTSESGEVPWSSLRYLTNEERDQIDLQTRMILAKCADKVKEMEILEKSSCVIRLMSS